MTGCSIFYDGWEPTVSGVRSRRADHLDVEAVPALRIGEHLNVIKDIEPGLFSCLAGFSADTLARR